MEIFASKILPISNLDEYKIHFAVWNGEEQPLDVFVRDPDEWKDWNSWRGGRNDFSRKFIFSLIRYHHQPNKWLFGGIFEVIERNANSYNVKLIDLHREYIGRLLIHYPGPGTRGRAFYLENHFNKLKVAQLFERPFEGENFAATKMSSMGFCSLNQSLSRANQTGRQRWRT